MLTRDQTGCIRRFSKYPPLESITIIIKLALKHKNIFEDEIKQKNPNKRAIKAKDERIEVVTLPKKEIYNEHMLQQDLPKESPQKDQMQLLTKLEAIHRKYIDLYSVEDSKTLESILKEFKAQLTS